MDSLQGGLGSAIEERGMTFRLDGLDGLDAGIRGPAVKNDVRTSEISGRPSENRASSPSSPSSRSVFEREALSVHFGGLDGLDGLDAGIRGSGGEK